MDYVDIDVELPDNDMELDSQLKPMVRSFHSLLSPNSVRFQSAVNCTKRHNASKCIEVRQHALTRFKVLSSALKYFIVVWNDSKWFNVL